MIRSVAFIHPTAMLVERPSRGLLADHCAAAGTQARVTASLS